MRATDILINIVDVTATEAGATNPSYRPMPLPLTVDGSHAVKQEGYEAPAAVIRGVQIDAHSFYLSLGSAVGAVRCSRRGGRCSPSEVDRAMETVLIVSSTAQHRETSRIEDGPGPTKQDRSP